MKDYVTVIGAGLAGVEATYQLVQQGIPVHLYEMRPMHQTEAHKTEDFAELVCSNSLRGDGIAIGVGLLKEELRRLGSLIMESADLNRIPAGGALAVNRKDFSAYLTQKIKNHPLVNVIYERVTTIPLDHPVVLATGPLTEGPLFKELETLLGQSYCHFFDGAAPIVAADSLDYSQLFFASRYGKGDGEDYLNCPMTKETYEKFYKQLITSERSIPHLESEKEVYFEGCMPIEIMAKRGEQTLRFGPLKPVGLNHPETDERYYAVLQLRAENREKTMYNLVGCQTGLVWTAQKALIQSLPGMAQAEILRYGVVHRNSYINSPEVLTLTGALKAYPNLYVAGQLSGVEGYVESAASGYWVGRHLGDRLKEKEPKMFPKETMIGALAQYLVHGQGKHFQPMNANFGLLPPLPEKIRDKKLKKEKLAERSLELLQPFVR